MKKQKLLCDGFQIGGDCARRSRRKVVEQEKDSAVLIGGRRHIGSGALPGLKSDASSGIWQLEAKQTEKKSIGVTLDWLEKITREARTQDKRPMLHIRFLDIPDGMVVDRDWVMIPARFFNGDD
jgi:hypothetical protein